MLRWSQMEWVMPRANAIAVTEEPPADMNGSGTNGGDIQAFLDRIIEGGGAGYDCGL